MSAQAMAIKRADLIWDVLRMPLLDLDKKQRCRVKPAALPKKSAAPAAPAAADDGEALGVDVVDEDYMQDPDYVGDQPGDPGGDFAGGGRR